VCETTPPAAGSGSVIINADVLAGNNCPLLTNWVVSPLQTSPLGAITAAAAASDNDTQDHLTFSWSSAMGGIFTTPDGALTLYTCPPTVGVMNDTLSVVVSDNHTPVPCMAGVSVPVTCVENADAGAGTD